MVWSESGSEHSSRLRGWFRLGARFPLERESLFWEFNIDVNDDGNDDNNDDSNIIISLLLLQY